MISVSDASGAESVQEAPAQDEGQEQPEHKQSQPDPYEKISGRLDELAAQSQTLHEMFQSFQAQPEEDDSDDYPLDEGDDGYEEQEAQRILDRMVEERVQQALTPIEQRQQLRDRESAYEKLVETYPGMKDPETAKAVLHDAADLLERINPQAIESPVLVELAERIYKARTADERAAQEKPAGSRQDVDLEQGGGAAPVDREESIQDRMVKQMLRERKEAPNPFA